MYIRDLHEKDYNVAVIANDVVFDMFAGLNFRHKFLNTLWFIYVLFVFVVYCFMLCGLLFFMNSFCIRTLRVSSFFGRRFLSSTVSRNLIIVRIWSLVTIPLLRLTLILNISVIANMHCKNYFVSLTDLYLILVSVGILLLSVSIFEWFFIVFVYLYIIITNNNNFIWDN